MAIAASVPTAVKVKGGEVKVAVVVVVAAVVKVVAIAVEEATLVTAAVSGMVVTAQRILKPIATPIATPIRMITVRVVGGVGVSRSWSYC